MRDKEAWGAWNSELAAERSENGTASFLMRMEATVTAVCGECLHF